MWKFFQGEDEEQQDELLEGTEGLCSLSSVQRVYAFAACLLAGLVLMFLSLVVFAMPIKFALLFTFGNVMAIGRHSRLRLVSYCVMNTSSVYIVRDQIAGITRKISIGSTAFLIGPEQQLRMMLDPVRIYATAIYVGCVIVALVFALLIHSKILTLVAIICEVCALIWYSLSYIPFARRMVSEVTIRLFDTEI